LVTSTEKKCPRCNNTDNSIVLISDLKYKSNRFADHFGSISFKELCPNCIREIEQGLSAAAGQSMPKKPNELREGTHYYVENGFLVFTTTYHIIRGNCCGSLCRHCPWGHHHHTDLHQSDFIE